MVVMFTAAIFVAAFLLFLIQPLAARLVLPHLGGSPAVWTGTMMFFQVMLLAGYAYAHVIGRLGVRAQAIVHGVVLLSCVVFLPLGLPGWWAEGSPSNSELGPLGGLLIGLVLSVGLPFFAISSASPLIQSWFARTGHRRAHDPYFLYAASNAGSLLGLLAYPLVVEPALGLHGQGWAWGIGYGVFLVLATGCWVSAWKAGRPGTRATTAKPVAASARPAPLSRRARWRERGLWVALAAVVSSLSLGATQTITTDIAAVPLLWVVPLCVYLLTFIVAFSRFGAMGERIGRGLLPLAAVAVTAVVMLRMSHPFVTLAGIHVMALAAAGLACHGRLAARRPGPERLTEYYLLMSLGGALGGVFNAVVAPLVFSVVLEYPLALAACCGMLAVGGTPRGSAARGVAGRLLSRLRGEGGAERAGQSGATRARGRLARRALVVLVCMVAVGGYMVAAEALIARLDIEDVWAVRLLTVGVPCLLALVACVRPAVQAGLVALLAGQATMSPVTFSEVPQRIEYIERSFFGVHMITMRPPLALGEGMPRVPALRMLRHGTTTHGQQWFDQERRFEPLSYYDRTGPVGDVFARMDARLRAVAVVGLGAGTIAAYGRDGMQMDFFEIDPTVARLASSPHAFTFVSDSAAEVRIIVVDGRLGVSAQPEGRYDLIVLDAFSSDAIPVHLLTREAMEMYRSRLAPGGAILVHVSNRHFDLVPVLTRAASGLGMGGAHVYRQVESAERMAYGAQSSSWVILTSDRGLIDSLAGEAGWRPLGEPDGRPTWTDDYANALEALRL